MISQTPRQGASGTTASEHIIWYCKYINVYLGAYMCRMQAYAFVLWLLPKRTLPTIDDFLATIQTNDLRWISIISTEDSKQQCANQSYMLHVSFHGFRSHDYSCLLSIYVLKVPDGLSFSSFCQKAKNNSSMRLHVLEKIQLGMFHHNPCVASGL